MGSTVSESVLHMALIPHLVCAYPDAEARVEAAGRPLRATLAVNVLGVEVRAKLVDVVAHEPDYRTCVQQRRPC